MTETPRVILLTIPSACYDRGLLEGVTTYAQIHGPWIFYLAGDHPDLPIPASDSLSGGSFESKRLPPSKFNRLMPDFDRLDATGIIGRIQGPEIAERLIATGLPIVGGIALSQAEITRLQLRSKVSEIVADANAIGAMVAEHFLERGFWNYAYCGYIGRDWSGNRLVGYSTRLAEAGFAPLAYQPAKTEHGLSWKEEMPHVADWLKSLPRPVAVMTCNDKRGRQILEACFLCGLRVPEDVAVVGVDNDHLFGNLSNPPLSSVALNLSKAGYQAADLLDQLTRGKVRKQQQIVIDPLWVVARGSSDIIATDDKPLAAALRFIREHAKEPIKVTDVAQEAGISRRGLELRFQNLLRKSIHDEIMRVRLEHAKQLLVETNLSVERIAQLTSFCSLSHLGCAFRLEIGMTPAQYRKSKCIS